MRQIFVICLILLASGCAGPKSQSQNLQGFHQVSEGIYRGGRPDHQGVQELIAYGIQTVVSFEEDESVIQSERVLMETAGIDFHSIPISIYEWPSDEKVLEYLDLVLDPTKRPIYLHCHDGKDRTGTMVGVYRVMWEGMGPRKAYEEAKAYGFWPYRGDAELKKFIHQLNDRKNYFKRADEWRARSLFVK